MSGDELGRSLSDMWRSVVLFLPSAAVCLVILIAGYLLARLARTITARTLRRIGFDRAVSRGPAGRLGRPGAPAASDVCARIAFAVVLLCALQLAFGLWGPNPAANLLDDLISWLPRLLVAIVIVVVAGAAAGAARDLIVAVLGDLGYARFLARAAATVIAGLGLVAGLDQAGIATSVTRPVLIAILATVAGVIIVGVGGGLVRPMQHRWEDWLNRAATESAVIREQARAYAEERSRRTAPASAPDLVPAGGPASAPAFVPASVPAGGPASAPDSVSAGGPAPAEAASPDSVEDARSVSGREGIDRRDSVGGAAAGGGGWPASDAGTTVDLNASGEGEGESENENENENEGAGAGSGKAGDASRAGNENTAGVGTADGGRTGDASEDGDRSVADGRSVAADRSVAGDVAGSGSRVGGLVGREAGSGAGSEAEDWEARWAAEERRVREMEGDRTQVIDLSAVGPGPQVRDGRAEELPTESLTARGDTGASGDEQVSVRAGTTIFTPGVRPVPAPDDDPTEPNLLPGDVEEEPTRFLAGGTGDGEPTTFIARGVGDGEPTTIIAGGVAEEEPTTFITRGAGDEEETVVQVSGQDTTVIIGEGERAVRGRTAEERTAEARTAEARMAEERPVEGRTVGRPGDGSGDGKR